MKAARNGHESIVKMLIEAGSELEKKDFVRLYYAATLKIY